MRLIFVVFLVSILTGCQNDSYQAFASRELAHAEALIEEGKINESYPIVSKYLVDKYNQKKAHSFISEHPAFKAKLPTLVAESITNITYLNGLVHTRAIIRELRTHNFIGAEDERRLLEHLGKTTVEGNHSGRFAVDYTDTAVMNEIPALAAPEARRIIFSRSLERLRTEPAPPPQLVSGVFEAAAKSGPQSEEVKALEKALPQMRLKLEDIRTHVASVFPAQARKMIADSTVSVRLIVAPEDRLLQEDLGAKLRSISPAISLAENGQQPTATIHVKKLQWEERQAPERTQPVMYSRGQVDLLAAAMLMPRNASYLYDLTTGGIELAYAFDIKVQSKGVAAYDTLLRDKINKQWRTCSNARIQNVFGGVEPATFVANDHMQQTCHGGEPMNAEQVRDEALNRVMKSIKEIPAIAKAAALY